MKMIFKRHRQDDGKLTDWYEVDSLPETWPDGATVGIYPHSGNRIYNVPGDRERYYEMLDGAECHNCGVLIDKSTYLHAELRTDREVCLCKECWGRINHGEFDIPTLEDGQPLYRLVNSPIYRD